VVFICKHFLAKQFVHSLKQFEVKKSKNLKLKRKKKEKKPEPEIIHATILKKIKTIPEEFETIPKDSTRTLCMRFPKNQPERFASVFWESSQEFSGNKPTTHKTLTNPKNLNQLSD